MERLTKDNGKAFEPSRYSLADISTYKIYDLFYEITFKVLQKLGEYEDAEEQGLLLRLPCKVGDTVWEVNAERKRISEFRIETITVYPYNVIQFNWTLLEGIYKNVVGFSKAELGKTVFLTREEAEAKLAEMEEKDD